MNLVNDRIKRFFIAVLISLNAMVVESSAESVRPRVIISTDMKGYDIDRDLDDIASMIRFLVYSNEFDVEGLIAARACAGADNNGAATTRPDIIHDLVDRYADVFPTLKKHASGFPTPESLHHVVKEGTQGDPLQPCWKAENDMTAVGDGKSTEASDWIIEVVDREDKRPVWFLVWGKSLDLAQALFDIRQSRGEEKARDFVSKLRVYDVWGQCECGAWIAHHFPGVFYIRSWLQVKGMSNEPGDTSNMQDPWIHQNIIANHGRLGEVYPSREHQAGNVEGDSPSFLYLIHNGLSDPAHPEWGSWGGRMTAQPVKNVSAIGDPPIDREWRDFWMYDDVPDKIWDPKLPRKLSLRVPVSRWRDAFQRDFAARMDWCVSDFASANHPPKVVVDGDATREVLTRRVRPGESVTLSAEESSDPDGDRLQFQWWRYQDADNLKNEIFLDQSPDGRVRFAVPKESKAGEVHLILEVTDDGMPGLTRYRRVIVRVSEGDD
ncbi:MAG: nucleoside hydrolase-like domain-containing protein [Planctomycetota bacterium]